MKTQPKDIQLYDTPYEPEGNGVESDSESVVSQRLRESKLPQDDDRPADEYDQPWEWNKVTIPALAGKGLPTEQMFATLPLGRETKSVLEPDQRILVVPIVKICDF